MSKTFGSSHSSRFIVNPDEKTEQSIKEMFGISGDENIQLIIDDSSSFRKLQTVVVLTNNGIYWNSKEDYFKTISGNTESVIRGKGFASVKQLCTSSVFVNTARNGSIVYIIGNSSQLLIPFRNFFQEAPLKITFFDYLANYSGGYKPEDSKNESVYKKIRG
ncbi:hypothetical protein K7I13_14365 [Brucepastera parasyntrophica]|uniref:hypothetical protein n=1 Tax=Brucepastera parasyntrophica TaxID=2880008 RepID=UPI002108DF48|nr:hypothetical protein [Brucepastera parasyntrophica]ULQ59625.1 hypothetical protein K7I13_14365 [Brucepastera parasyntrophica]